MDKDVHGVICARRRAPWLTVSALLISSILFAMGIEPSMAAITQSDGVNRTLPKVTPPTQLHFSRTPTEAQFLQTGLFDEPLAPVSAVSPQENRELVSAGLPGCHARLRRD